MEHYSAMKRNELTIHNMDESQNYYVKKDREMHILFDSTYIKL